MHLCTDNQPCEMCELVLRDTNIPLLLTPADSQTPERGKVITVLSMCMSLMNITPGHFTLISANPKLCELLSDTPLPESRFLRNKHI